MKKPLLFFAILYFSFSLNQEISAQVNDYAFLIDTAITVMKSKSYMKDKVNWEALRTALVNRAKAATNINEFGGVAKDLLGTANDFHGAFFYRDSVFKYKQKIERPFPGAVTEEWKKGVYLKSLLLERQTGYLRIPYITVGSKEEMSKKAQQLNDSLCSLLEKGVKGLIIDLRLNGGGAMYPMMLGLEQVLGNGKLGSFTAAPKEQWIIKQHSFLMDARVLCTIQPKCTISATEMPVVVLIGGGTGSSGEFLAMSFKGRKHTLFLGSPTVGYVTSIEGLPIGKAYLYLSTGYGMDRNGIIYTDAITPDIIDDSIDQFNNIANDPKVKKQCSGF